MSRPTPSPSSPFPLEAFAHQRHRAREAEKRSQWKGLLALLKSFDILERASFCPITVLGLVVLFVRMLDRPEVFAEAFAIGLAEARGFETPEPPMKSAPLQVVTSMEPEQALLARLSAEGFCRMTRPGLEPVIFMGRGLLGDWKAAQSNGVRVTKLDLPGGTIQGMPVLPEGEGAGPETGTADAGSELANPASTGEVPATRTDAPGAGAGPAEAAERAAVTPETRGTLGPRARKAVPRPGPADGERGSGRPYVEAGITAPAGQPDWTLHRATDAERDALMLAAVTGQGPVDLDTAIEAVRLGLDVRAILTNGRSRLEQALGRLKAAGAVIVTEGDFYDIPGRPVLARDRTGCGEGLRRLGKLPPVEIDAAIREELAEGGPAEDAAVVVGAARRLGYPLKSPATNTALAGIIARRIAVLVEAEAEPVIRSANGLAVEPPPVDRRAGEDLADGGTRTDGPGDDADGEAGGRPPVLRAAE